MREIPGATRVVGQFGNLWVMAHLDMMQGQEIPIGKHAFDHVSWLGRGAVKMTVNGEAVIYRAQNYILGPAGMSHGIEVLEDHTDWTCFHVILDDKGQPDPTLDHYRHTLEVLHGGH
jgi:quercetin dioxygenase-like cupin family protein